MRVRHAAPGAVLFAACLGVFVARHHHCLYDDAFIYLRYVRNAAAGCGVRWNCGGAPVEGFSSPLHYVLLLLGSLLTSKLVLVSQVVGALTMLAAGVLAAIAAGASSSRARDAVVAAVAVSLALGLDHYALLNAVTGMDSGTSAAFVLLTWLLLDTGRPRLAALAAVASSSPARRRSRSRWRCRSSSPEGGAHTPPSSSGSGSPR